MSVLKQKRSKFKDKKAKVEIDNYDGYATINYTLNSISEEELSLNNFFEGEKEILEENNTYALSLFKKLGLNDKDKYAAVVGLGVGQDEHLGFVLKDEKLNKRLVDSVNKLVLAENPELKQKIISEIVEEKNIIKPRKPKM